VSNPNDTLQNVDLLGI